MKRVLFFFLLCATARAYYGPQTSFNAGQVSPLLDARADFEKYYSSCRTLQNMLVTIQGPALKRPGTQCIAVTKNSGQVRLIPFEYSTDDAYILEFGNYYMRVYRDGAQVLDGGSAVEITTPYSTAELSTIQYALTGNEMYLVDGTDAPRVLSRTSHTAWTLEEVEFTGGPFLPENDTTTTLTPDGTTGAILLTASDSVFDSDHEGSVWAVEQVRASSVVTGSFTANGNSEVSPSFTGDYSFTTSGTWSGTVTLQRSTNGGTSWHAALSPLVDTNFDNPDEYEESGAIYRVVMSDYSSGTCTYTFTILDNMNKGVVRITSVASATSAYAKVLTDLVDTSATTQWREAYWSDYRGWPDTVAFHQQRLVYGGSTSYPQTLWFGTQDPDDFSNFLEGTLDTSAFTVVLEGSNPIRWLLSQDYLLIGASGSCGKWGQQGEPVTPTSANYQEQTRYGAAAFMAMAAGDSVLYVERGARNVRELAFNLQYDRYLSPSLTFLSPEMTESGIVDVAFQVRPDPTLWCVLDDGEAAALTYYREQSVLAWSKQVTDGDFESVAVISGGEEEDEVWFAVKRTINGTDYRYIEQMQPRDWGDDQEDAWFVDCGLTWDGGAAVTVTGVTQADPGVVSAAGHGFSDGDQVLFEDVAGMTELNDRVFTVANAAAGTFELKDADGVTDIDTQYYTAYTSGGTVTNVEKTFGGLSYLKGKTVAVFGDGIVLSNETVNDYGQVTVDKWCNYVLIGLPYTAILETMPIRVDPQDYAVNKKISRLYVDFYETGAASYGDADDLTEVDFFEQASVTAYQDFYTSTAAPKQFAWAYGGSRKQTVYLESSAPAPMGIRAIVPQLEVRE